MFIRSPKELAMFVASRRKTLKMSQAAVADLVGLKQKTISAFENKPASIKLETLFYILSAVECEMIINPKGYIPKSDNQWKEEW